MKKFFAIILTLLVMTALFSVTAFAEESTSVMKVQYGSETKEFSVFDDGWNFAMEQANDGKEVYVTLFKDWEAVDGQFTDDWINGSGFDYDAIYFADDVNITLDLGGHTIDRGLTSSELNGEVMFVNDDANVTVKNGTIKGGYSNNGAGGIHIEGANVKLIDLTFTGNRVRDDDGAAIQHVDGGELYMKNCRFVDNDCSDKGLDIYGTVYLDSVDKVLIEDCYFADNDNIDYGAGIYADECVDFVIKNTTFENLHAGDRGGAIWVGGKAISISDKPDEELFSKFYIYNCKFNNNSCGNYGGAIYAKMAELHVYDTEFKGNYSDWDGGAVYLTAGDVENDSVPSYFYRSTFDGNRAGWDGGAIYCNDGLSVFTGATTYGCDFINNSAGENGGAVFVESACDFFFYFDEESGKPGTIKNNYAGMLGGGVFQDTTWNDIGAEIRLGGEIYVSGNVSSLGDDDLYLKEPYDVYIDVITSPEGSVGVRFVSEDGGDKIPFADEKKITDPKVLFANNEGIEIVLGERPHYEYGSTVPTMVPCLTTVKTNAPVGSIFGEGSLTMIVSFVALVASVASIIVNVSSKKQKAIPATSENENE